MSEANVSQGLGLLIQASIPTLSNAAVEAGYNLLRASDIADAAQRARDAENTRDAAAALQEMFTTVNGKNLVSIQEAMDLEAKAKVLRELVTCRQLAADYARITGNTLPLLVAAGYAHLIPGNTDKSLLKVPEGWTPASATAPASATVDKVPTA